MQFSVFLPVRNGGEYFRDCMGSVLAQTCADLSLTVLDNASTDGTPEWAESIDDDRVTVIRSSEPLGIEASWARICDLPKAEFSTIIGHDDMLDPGYLQVMQRLIADHPTASLYHSHFRLINDRGHVTRSCKPMPEIERAAGLLESRLTFRRDSFGTGYVFRSEAYDAMSGIPLFAKLLYADDALWLSLIGTGVKATASEECFSYRLHSESMSFSPAAGGAYDALDSFVQFLGRPVATDGSVGDVVRHHLPGHLIDMYRWGYFALRRDRGAFRRDAGRLRTRIESSARAAAALLTSAGAPDGADFPDVVRHDVLRPMAHYAWRVRGRLSTSRDRPRAVEVQR